MVSVARMVAILTSSIVQVEQDGLDSMATRVWAVAREGSRERSQTGRMGGTRLNKSNCKLLAVGAVGAVGAYDFEVKLATPCGTSLGYYPVMDFDSPDEFLGL